MAFSFWQGLAYEGDTLSPLEEDQRKHKPFNSLSGVLAPGGRLHFFNIPATCILLCAVASAQGPASNSNLLAPTTPEESIGVAPAQHALASQETLRSALEWSPTMAARIPTAFSRSRTAPDGPHRITLDEAKQQAAAADNPMVRLGQLQVEAAKQHREGAQSDYFPKLSSTLANFHFKKFMG